jgi:DNA-3-methyladenine glycosylase
VTALASLPPLPRAFYARPTVAVAHDLLGKILVRRRGSQDLQRARIVEVEAYLGERDAASHARRGPTPRAAIMFGPPGCLYVYLIYGMHHCMNFVTEADGTGFSDGRRALTGPGKLCAGLGITRADNGHDLTRRNDFYVADDGSPAPRRAASARIGVGYAGVWAARKLRFYVPGSPDVCKA